MRNIFRLFTLLTSLLLTSVIAAEKPNIVIVIADDVSWSSFGCTESGLLTRTPNVDKLASQGVRFTNFFGSVAQCGPIRHELYTGLLPPTSGVYSNGSKPKGDYKNIATYMKALGYKVGLTGKTHFKKVSDFEKVSGFESNGNHDAPTWEMSGVKSFIESAQSEKKPFCMLVASVNAHHPWTVGNVSNFPKDKIVVPPHMIDSPLTREALAIHAAEVEELDNQVGASMKLIDDMKLTENTVFIFLSEQGTALPQGKWSIYDYGTRALCVVRWPAKLKPAVTDAVAMYCDISATLVDIAGGKAPANDGKSLLPVLKGESSDHRDHAFLIHQAGGYTQRAIRNKEFKFIWNPEKDKDYFIDVIMGPRDGKFFAKVWKEWIAKAKNDPSAQAKVNRVIKHPEFELYNVKNDPWELNNLASSPEYSGTLKQMHAQLKADMAKLNDEFSTADPKAAKKAKKEEEQKEGEADDSKKAERKKKREKSKEAETADPKKEERKKKREEKKAAAEK